LGYITLVKRVEEAGRVTMQGKTGTIIYGWPPENMDFLAPKVFLHNWFKILY
jgi:hypothetical protein